MAQVQITDVVVPAEFTAYQVENSMVSTALFQSGVVLPNGEMQAQLQAGAQQFTVPFWSDIPDIEADITTDNPAVLSTAQKITAASMPTQRSANAKCAKPPNVENLSRGAPPNRSNDPTFHTTSTLIPSKIFGRF